MPETKIVLIEHPKDTFKDLADTLRKKSFKVSVVTSAFDALDELATRGAQAVIAPTVLPDIAGYQLAALIKSNEMTQSLPVVLLRGGVAGSKWAKEANKVGADAFWVSAAKANLALEYTDATSKDAKQLVHSLNELIETAKKQNGAKSKSKAIRSYANADLAKSYAGLLDDLLAERIVTRLIQPLTISLEPRKRFLECYFNLVSELFRPDLLGIVVASGANPWSSFQVSSELSKESFDSMLKNVSKELSIPNTMQNTLHGTLKEQKGKNLAEVEILPVVDVHHGTAALVFGSFEKNAFSVTARSFMTQLQLQIRPILELLLAKQEIETLAVRERYRSSTDLLTGLYNLEFFVGFLQQQLLFSFRQKLAVAVAIIDIDNFDKINEEHGYETGDTILSNIANKLLTITRASDLIARYGGDEFAVVLPNTDAAGAKVLAEKIRLEVQQIEFAKILGRKGLHVTVSVGCSQFNMEDLNPETILRDAKLALQKAKEAGRNCVRVQKEG